jgi:hypothetical protein
MNDDEIRLILRAAIFLIVLALVAIGIADHWNMHDLSSAGGIVLGYGGGILQSKGNSQSSATRTGDILNVPPSPKE